MTVKETMQAMYQMNFQGNIIPHNWYKNIIFDNGKPQLNAIIILSEIVYWYRPKLVKDETTGQVIGLEKRFAADLLQRSYDSFSDQFGLSKKQVRDAVVYLEELGVIKRHLRNIPTKNGVLSNVLFIDLDPEILKALTYDVDTSLHRNRHPPTTKETPPYNKIETYTDTTTKNTTYTHDINEQAHLSQKDKPDEKDFSEEKDNTEEKKDHIPTGKKPKEKDSTDEKPKTQLMNKFIECTNLKKPKRKSDLGFWWSSVNELYEIADQDVDIGKQMIEFTVNHMLQAGLTISSPNSIINPARAVMARRASQHSSNGFKPQPQPNDNYPYLRPGVSIG